MRSTIAIIMAVLGTILVLSGAAALWASALVQSRISAQAKPVGEGEPGRVLRTAEALSKLPAPDRLIMWGVVLLALSAVAAQAISFSASATSG